jgi:hypothetical protein
LQQFPDPHPVGKMSTHFLVAFAGSIAFYNSTQSDRDDVHFSDVPWRFCRAVRRQVLPGRRRQRNSWGQDHCHPTRAHGDWWLARAAWATIAGAPEPGKQKHPMGVVSPSLNLTQLIPALLAGKKQRSSTFPLEWFGTSWNLGPTKAWSW